MQQESPSAEMVMLERLFLQSERLLLGEERRRARGDPGEPLHTFKEFTLMQKYRFFRLFDDQATNLLSIKCKMIWFLDLETLETEKSEQV